MVGLVVQPISFDVADCCPVKKIQDADTVILLENGTIALQESPESIGQMGQFTRLVSDKNTQTSSDSTPSDSNGDVDATTKAAGDTKTAKSKKARSGDEDSELAIRKNGDSALYAYYFRHIGWAYGLSCFLSGFISPCSNLAASTSTTLRQCTMSCED